MTTQQIQYERVCFRGVGRSSQTASLGATLHGARVAESPRALNSGDCTIYRFPDVGAKTLNPQSFSDFDSLMAEVSDAPDLIEGRKWLAQNFGGGDLSALRLHAGMSQKQLAEKCSLEQPHISRYESGKHAPLLSAAKAMSEALGVTLDDYYAAWENSRRTK